MAGNSAVSQFSVNPDDYAFDYSPASDDSGSSFWNGFADFFSFGARGKQAAKQQAEKDAFNALQANRYEEAKLNSARNYEIWLDSTKYQRAVEDAKKAGINPYLLFSQNINTSSGSSASAVKGHDPYRLREKANSSSSIVNSALRVLALILLRL